MAHQYLTLYVYHTTNQLIKNLKCSTVHSFVCVFSLQVDIDFENKAFFLVFTVLGYPPGMDEQLNELPDAIRPLPEVKKINLDLVEFQKRYLYFNKAQRGFSIDQVY